MNDKLRELLE